MRYDKAEAAKAKAEVAEVGDKEYNLRKKPRDRNTDAFADENRIKLKLRQAQVELRRAKAELEQEKNSCKTLQRKVGAQLLFWAVPGRRELGSH